MGEKILVVIGTRPEAIKLAPVIREITRRADRLEPRVVVTGQHREMLDQVLDLWDIRPDYDLDLMEPDQTLSRLTSRALEGLSEVIEAEQPEWLLVQGDTTTAMTGALAAFYQGIPVGHVEAGLRTYDMDHPFPEEANRRIVDLVSRMHFAPTRMGAENLLREGVDPDRVFVTGNTVIDAFHAVSELPFARERTPIAGLPEDKRLILVTAHRRENFGHGIDEICRAVHRISEYDDVHIAMPVHPNPHVSGPVHAALSGVDNITLLPPLDYQPLVWLLKHCMFVITDSGGLQEEVTGVGKPALVLRDSTERPEGVMAGSAVLVGAHYDRITHWAHRLLNDGKTFERMSTRSRPYGDGQASVYIVDLLTEPDRVIDLTRPALDAPAYDGTAAVAYPDESPRSFSFRR